MTLSASSELPIIDFSKDAMKPGTETWDLTCKHVRKALEEYGCFVATFSEINNELYNAIFRSLEKLFDLPKDTKRRYASNGRFNGYISDLPISPLYEAMAIPDPLTIQTIQNLTLSMWPQGDAPFSEILHSYAKRVLELEKAVRKAIFQSYGLERHFEKECESMKCSLRLLKYGAPMTDEATHGAGTHCDKNFITILQANRDGLQVQNKDGEWINVTPSGSSLIVLMGELSFGWSNGRLKCPLHKVMMSGYKPRYSIGLFSSKIGIIETPSELVDEQHPQLFKPFDHNAILDLFQQQMMDNTYTSDNDNIVPVITTHFAI